MLEAIQYLSGVLAVVAVVGAFALIAVRLFAVDSAAGRFGARVAQRRIEISTAIGVFAMAASLYFSEVAEMVPCRLCWFQRILMYPIAIVGLVALIRRDRGARWYLGAFAAIGFAVSAYHNLIELRPEFDSETCALFGPACSIVYFRVFGVFSLAVMALCGFFAVLVLNVVNFPDRKNDLASTP